MNTKNPRLVTCFVSGGLALSLTMVFASGCLNEREYVDPSQGLRFGSGDAQTLNLDDGNLRGDFGARRGFNGAATSLDGASDPEWRSSTVTVARSEATRGTGMVILWTDGLVLEDLDTGRHEFHFDPQSVQAPPLGVNVCSGVDSASIDYDRPADRVTVSVADTADGRRYDVHTETALVDPATGNTTDRNEVSDTSFVLTGR